MKYCRTCKTRAEESATVCAKCGKPLSMLGAPQPTAAQAPPAPSSPTASAPTAPASAAAPASVASPLTLEGQIGELEAAKNRNLRRGRILAIICGAVVFAFVITFYEIYNYAVLSYAVLENVEIEQDPNVDNTVHVSFKVVRPGKVAFDRQSGANRTEKLDEFHKTGEEKFAWTWPSDKQTGINFRVVFRKWLTCTEVQKHFAVTGKGRSGSVDVVFLLDTTESMTPFIDDLKKKCVEFAHVVRESGYDCRLGLIGFGDVEINEPMEVHSPTGDLQLFQTWVATVPRTQGGDNPESSVEALQKALTLEFRPDASVCFVHITDAECHNQQQLGSVARELEGKKIITYVVSEKNWRKLYERVCVNGGEFYAIEDAKFADILLKVAHSISSQVGYR